MSELWKARAKRTHKAPYVPSFEPVTMLEQTRMHFYGCLPVIGYTLKRVHYVYVEPTALCKLPEYIANGGALTFHEDFDYYRITTPTKPPTKPVRCKDCCEIIGNEPKWKGKFNVDY